MTSDDEIVAKFIREKGVTSCPPGEAYGSNLPTRKFLNGTLASKGNFKGGRHLRDTKHDAFDRLIERVSWSIKRERRMRRAEMTENANDAAENNSKATD